MNTQSIKPDLMVHARGQDHGQESMRGAPGVHVGTVDHMEGDQWIKLKKADSPDGRHHWIPLAWVERADDKAVYLKKTAEEFARELIDENPAPRH